jgi:hypothetical protein
MVQHHVDQPCLAEVQMNRWQANEIAVTAGVGGYVLPLELKWRCFEHK